MNIVPFRHPPGCSCGCQDCGPAWRQDAIDCYNELNRFRSMVKQVIAEMGLAPGVTDGSDAAPGQVGEFIHGNANFAYAAYPNDTTTNLAVLVVPPGDWDLRAFMEMSTAYNVASFVLSPEPSGISNSMTGAIGSSDPTWTIQLSYVPVIGTIARASFSVPTLLAFKADVSQGGTVGNPAGSATLVVEGRRMR